MLKEIGEILIERNRGITKDRVDNTDVSACMMVLSGIGHDVAYYLCKCRGLLSDSVVLQRADAYFSTSKIEMLMDALRPLVSAPEPAAESSDVAVMPSDWREMDMESLTPEELEKMGTYLLRNASMRGGDVDTKEINDLIKMLDSVGALPKKKQEDKDVKQVVVNVPYNAVCSCGKEIFDPSVDDYFTRRIIAGDYQIDAPPKEAIAEIKKKGKQKK